MTGIDDVHVLAVGPADHGVVKHGLELAAAAGAPVLRFDDAAELDAALATDREGASPLPGAIHVAFTDALFGGPAEAPRRIRELARGGACGSVSTTCRRRAKAPSVWPGDAPATPRHATSGSRAMAGSRGRWSTPTTRSAASRPPGSPTTPS